MKYSLIFVLLVLIVLSIQWAESAKKKKDNSLQERPSFDTIKESEKVDSSEETSVVTKEKSKKKRKTTANTKNNDYLWKEIKAPKRQPKQKTTTTRLDYSEADIKQTGGIQKSGEGNSIEESDEAPTEKPEKKRKTTAKPKRVEDSSNRKVTAPKKYRKDKATTPHYSSEEKSDENNNDTNEGGEGNSIEESDEIPTEKPEKKRKTTAKPQHDDFLRKEETKSNKKQKPETDAGVVTEPSGNGDTFPYSYMSPVSGEAGIIRRGDAYATRVVEGALRTINVVNELETPTDVNCRDANIDMGSLRIGPNSAYSFFFERNFWGFSQFRCTVWYDGTSEKGINFPAYNELELPDNNVFAIREDGIYLRNDKNVWVKHEQRGEAGIIRREDAYANRVAEGALRTINVVNELETSTYVNCRDANIDMGSLPVRPNSAYSFNFERSFWGFSHFWCTVWYNGTSEAGTKFPAYNEGAPDDNNVFAIRGDGIYLRYNENDWVKHKRRVGS